MLQLGGNGLSTNPEGWGGSGRRGNRSPAGLPGGSLPSGPIQGVAGNIRWRAVFRTKRPDTISSAPKVETPGIIATSITATTNASRKANAQAIIMTRSRVLK